MPITISEVADRETRERTAALKRRMPIAVKRGPGGMLNGSDLLREITRAMLEVPGARALDEYEHDAVRQSVAVQILARRRALPRDLRDLADTYADRCDLAGIGRVLRVDLARRERDPGGITRGEVGRSLIAARVRSTLVQRSDWQDSASRFRTRAESAKGSRRMIEALPESADAPHPIGLLARSLPIDRYAVDPADVPDLAHAVAARLLDDSSATINGESFITDITSHRRLTARLIQAMAVAGADRGTVNDAAVRALASLAAEQGRTLNAVRIDAARGAEVLTALDLEPADLVRIVREVAAREGLAREAREDRVSLPPVAHAAGEAIVQLARIGGSWDAESIGSDRSMPDRDPRTGEAPDLAPFPAVTRPGVALPIRRPYSSAGEPVSEAPAPNPRTDREPMDTLYRRAWGRRLADPAPIVGYAPALPIPRPIDRYAGRPIQASRAARLAVSKRGPLTPITWDRVWAAR